MATPENIDPLLNAQAAAIAQQAQIALDTLLVLLAAGVAVVDAVQRVQGTFNGAYQAQLGEAFSQVLGQAVSTGQIAKLPISGVPLSARLYRNALQTSAEVGELVKAHAAGMHDARALAMRLYDGYNPKDGIQRPIEARSLATLPKPLQQLLKSDIKLKGSYEALLNEVQRGAATLKTGALKAAYTELIDKWAAGKGGEALQRKLDVAFKEKTRYHANRIAQTELARAHQDKVGAELMQDSTIDVVQVVIAPTHPVTDICDYHARANLFGLGPGCYPKAKAPKPPFHPFCRCIARSRPDLSAASAREVPGGDAAYLRSLPLSDAARVMGSRGKLQKVLNGASVDDVINAHVDPAYHLSRLGQLDLNKSPFMADGGKVVPMKIDIDLRSEASLSKNDGDARAYVVGNGRRTGHEYLYAYDGETGKVLSTHTDRKTNGVGTPGYLESGLGDRSRKIVVHHNHPNSAPPSMADVLSVSSYSGIHAAFIHGHDGSLYRIQPLQRGNIEKAIEAMSKTAKNASRSSDFAALSDSEYTWLVGAARVSALSKAGFIKLSSNVLASEMINKMTDLLVVSALQSLK